MKYLSLYRNMTVAEKLIFIFSYLLSFTLFMGIVAGVYFSQWMNVFFASLALVLTYVPSLLERTIKIIIPLEFELVLTLYFFAALYLGGVHSYYDSFWWWDVFLHTTSGILLGFVGFLMMYILNFQKQVPLQMSPLFVCFFSVIFATSLGVFWEIFEFILDFFIDTPWQESLSDTMIDLIVNTFGAFVVSLIGYLYIRNFHFSILGLFIEKFLKKNPRFFRFP